MRSITIPVFPLQLVLFPTVPLPLHVFEERYRLMINQCIDGGEPFGVVYHRGSELEQVGCTAAVNQVLNRYDDGRLDVMTVGQQRFRIEALDDSGMFLTAQASVLADKPQPVHESLKQTAIRQLLAYAKLSDLQLDNESVDGLNANQLAYLIAGVDAVPLATKQRLLELDGAAERLRQSIDAIGQAIAQLEAMARIRSATGYDVDLKSLLN